MNVDVTEGLAEAQARQIREQAAEMRERVGALERVLGRCVTPERLAELVAGKPQRESGMSDLDALHAEFAYLAEIAKREIPPPLSPLQILLVWLTGEGDEAAIYGLLAAIVRELAEFSEPRIGAAIALALPIAVTRESTWKLEALVRGLAPIYGVSQGFAPERAAKFTQVIVAALDAAEFWDWGHVLRRMLDDAATEPDRIEVASDTFKDRMARIIEHLESHLPAEPDRECVAPPPPPGEHTDTLPDVAPAP